MRLMTVAGAVLSVAMASGFASQAAGQAGGAKQEAVKVSKLQNSIKIQASPDAVWKVLGNLSATHTWIPGVVSAKVDGSNRVCSTADGFEIKEVISDYSPGTKSYSYSQTQVPIPVKNSRGHLAVKPDGQNSVVVWDAQFEVLDPSKEAEVKGMVDGYYKQTLESLRKTVEGSR